MATVRLIDEAQADGKVRAIFEEIKAGFQLPFVPKLFRALAISPDQLEAVWSQLKRLFGRGHLDVKTKLLAALAVAATQPSPDFVTIHSAALKRLGTSDEEIMELLEVASVSASLSTLASGLALEPEI